MWETDFFETFIFEDGDENNIVLDIEHDYDGESNLRWTEKTKNLILAAPDLLEACKELLEGTKDVYLEEKEYLLDAIQEAVEKANGVAGGETLET